MGMGNPEIAKTLKIATRTVKAHFNNMFKRARISGGIPRVKLAVLLYRQFNAEEKASEALKKEMECLGISSDSVTEWQQP